MAASKRLYEEINQSKFILVDDVLIEKLKTKEDEN